MSGNKQPNSEQSTENSDENTVMGLNRRDVLQASAGTLSIGALGKAATGRALAASYKDQCTGSANYSKDTSYYWSMSDDSWTQEYCSGPDNVDRGQLTANILYYGSVRNDNTETWYHDFVTSGHSEGFSASPYGSCTWPDSFDRAANIYKTYEFFQNNQPGSTDIPKERGSKVKAWPPVGDSTNSEFYTDLLITTVAEAIGHTAAWPIGTAISIAAVFEDNFDTADRNSDTLEYKWGYGRDNAKPCASHFVFQNIESHAGADDSVDFTYYDEHWVRTAAANERWMQVSFNVSYNDSRTGDVSSSSLETSSDGSPSRAESKAEIGGSFPSTRVAKGDVVQDDDGNAVKVDRVSSRTEHFPGTPAEQRAVADLPGALGRHFDDDETVTFKRVPFSVTAQTASGKLVK